MHHSSLRLALFLLAARAGAQDTYANPLTTTAGLVPVGVRLEAATYRGREALHVLDAPRLAAGTVVLVPGVRMRTGTIDVDVAGMPRDGSPASVRGHIGVAFRAADDTTWDALYVRPTNGRANDQVRRNHATQYIAAPTFLFDRLRADAPGRYESYVDLETGAWTHLRIVVGDTTAALYVNGAAQPALVVSRLLGRTEAGMIGLWVGDDTDGWFSRLRVVATRP